MMGDIIEISEAAGVSFPIGATVGRSYISASGSQITTEKSEMGFTAGSDGGSRKSPMPVGAISTNYDWQPIASTTAGVNGVRSVSSVSDAASITEKKVMEEWGELSDITVDITGGSMLPDDDDYYDTDSSTKHTEKRSDVRTPPTTKDKILPDVKSVYESAHSKMLIDAGDGSGSDYETLPALAPDASKSSKSPINFPGEKKLSDLSKRDGRFIKQGQSRKTGLLEMDSGKGWSETHYNKHKNTFMNTKLEMFQRSNENRQEMINAWKEPRVIEQFPSMYEDKLKRLEKLSRSFLLGLVPQKEYTQLLTSHYVSGCNGCSSVRVPSSKETLKIVLQSDPGSITTCRTCSLQSENQRKDVYVNKCGCRPHSPRCEVISLLEPGSASNAKTKPRPCNRCSNFQGNIHDKALGTSDDDIVSTSSNAKARKRSKRSQSPLSYRRQPNERVRPKTGSAPAGKASRSGAKAHPFPHPLMPVEAIPVKPRTDVHTSGKKRPKSAARSRSRSPKVDS